MPIFNIKFQRLGEIIFLDSMGKLKNKKLIRELNQKYGKARWIYNKGMAKVLLEETGTTWIAEIHYVTAHGKGICRERIKRFIEKVYE